MPWRDGMRLDDYLDACEFKERGRPPLASRWVDEFKLEADIRSFSGIG